MADNPEPRIDKTMLVAYATATLLTGESLTLLPFVDENDVKSKFTELMESWSKSGFLLRGERVYPWVQVKHVEVSRVEEMPEAEAHARVLDWEKAEFSTQQNNFWRTKQKREKKEEKKEGSDGPPPH